MMVSNQIRTKRIALRISQIAFAQTAEISRYRLSMFECGYAKLTKGELAKIKAVFTKYKKDKKTEVANA